jgi:hypothetical protein
MLEMEYIFENVNLANLDIADDGKKVVLDFLDMTSNNWESIGKIRCNNVFLLNYQNSFLPDMDDGFACYVGEVTLQRIKKNEYDKFIFNHRFGSIESGGNYIDFPYEEANLLHLESGDVIIDIMCENLEIDKKSTLAIIKSASLVDKLWRNVIWKILIILLLVKLIYSIF